MGTVATEVPFQTSVEGTTTGQQCLLTSINQISHQMDAPCKIDLAQSHKAGNYVGWLMLMKCNIQQYYPKGTKSAKRHLNQTRKNVHSTKEKPAPLDMQHLTTPWQEST
jgi:hypothetical protein